MSNDSQPRDPNGQYGHKDHSYPEVVLAETVDGSFLFPPSDWANAQQYLEFWRTQPISDEALTNFASCYAAEWDEWAVPIIHEHMELWGDSPQGLAAQRDAGGSRERLITIRDAEVTRFTDELKRVRPDRIPTGIVRKVARAAQIMHNRAHLRNEAEREEVAKVPLHVSQSNETWTAHQFWDRYKLEDIMPDAFYSRENALLKQLRINAQI